MAGMDFVLYSIASFPQKHHHKDDNKKQAKPAATDPDHVC